MTHIQRATEYLLQSGYLDEISELVNTSDDREYTARQIITLVETCVDSASGEMFYEELYGTR